MEYTLVIASVLFPTLKCPKAGVPIEYLIGELAVAIEEAVDSVTVHLDDGSVKKYKGVPFVIEYTKKVE